LHFFTGILMGMSIRDNPASASVFGEVPENPDGLTDNRQADKPKHDRKQLLTTARPSGLSACLKFTLCHITPGFGVFICCWARSSVGNDKDSGPALEERVFFSRA
jgi:hypothetical protein